MAKINLYEINSPVTIEGGYSVESGLYVESHIVGLQMHEPSYDTIEYIIRVWVSKTAADGAEPNVDPKGYVTRQRKPSGMIHIKHYINADKFTYDTTTVDNKQEFTAASSDSFKDAIRQEIATALGKNISDVKDYVS